MQTGKSISGRLLPHFVGAACNELQLAYQSFSDDWVIRISNGITTKSVAGYNFDINQAAATAIATDKVAAYQALHSARLPAVEHRLFRTGDMPAIEDVSQGVVVKPLTGSGGSDVHYFKSLEDARKFMQTSHHKAWAVSPYLKINTEVRGIVLDGEILLMYEKSPQSQADGLLMFNLGRGATPRDISPDGSGVMAELAVQAQQVSGLRLAAVDCVILEDGSVKVLEINSSIMMEWYARHSLQNYQKAQGVYKRIVAAMMGL